MKTQKHEESGRFHRNGLQMQGFRLSAFSDSQGSPNAMECLVQMGWKGGGGDAASQGSAGGAGAATCCRVLPVPVGGGMETGQLLYRFESILHFADENPQFSY
ncbi:hypothetical protein [Prevotella denticola]|uniref:hypothetical protein n=1 Tax=Prevotella denticola TaxID=28129 RepID=UPI001BC8420D|nr:hypothetical protein [Prevotella denticola]MBW4758893.1 hypothetical protein [Prevotella denticola]QUI94001.1 hypothetical protein J5A64_01650 [Prevotella denticola]